MWFIVLGVALVCGQVNPDWVVTLDTVGGTTYDWWFDGPMHRDIVNSPDVGIHVTWMYSAETTGTSFPDRNMRYNFYDYVTNQWNWIDPDFMQSGVNVYADRAGFGNLDADLTTGIAIISRHGGTPTHVRAARDIAPGAGIYEYAEGPDGQGPAIASGQSNALHAAFMSPAGLAYDRIPTWPDWDTVLPLTGGLDYNIAASKVSPKVFICWTDNVSPVSRAYWRLSEDGGTTWGPVTELVAPPAYGGDTVTSFHITSLFPFYDQMDRLRIAASVIPVLHDTGYIMPAEIWHWCADNNPQWNEIHRAGCAPEHLLAPVGYNATYACRPSMGEDRSGNLFVAWEQFDSSNVEPLTGWLRAGVWACCSADGGTTWSPAIRLTPQDYASHRFPCVADWITDNDVLVLYLADPIAGFFVQGEHPGVNCMVICAHVSYHDAINDSRAPDVNAEFRIWPNPTSQTLHIAGGQRLVLLDVAGRERMKLHDGTNDIGMLSPGIYVVRDEQTRLSRKLVLRP